MKCCELPYRSNLNHCARCHQTISSLYWFDKHQDVDYDRRPAVRCLAPSDLGLIQDHRGVWMTRAARSKLLVSTGTLAAARSARRHAAA